MDLITRIEIAYFRSIYKERLDRLRGTNVIFGRNDSGKSNVLRALNLFFNNETNPGQRFSFDRDFCHARRAEADATKDLRKFVYVKVWFSPPPSWQPSLGKEFWVKKQWSVTREADPIVDSSIRTQRHQQFVTRFLNKVQFHYIPAIKDRRIFEHLLSEIYRVVASQEAFAVSLDDFSRALRERTDALTAGLLEDLGINSVISPPDDLSDLFRSLDFETNTEQGDSYSLTLQRGDGVQVRHIPAILAFLTDRSPADYHLWGFEEPENSLELANAIEEAKLFCRHGTASNKQIFLTSHSPAFFALDDPRVARHFVSRSDRHGERLTSKLRRISDKPGDEPAELMGETPHLPVISSYLRKAHHQIELLQAEGDRLAREMAARNRSIVFVEGQCDALVIGAAWNRFFGEQLPFDFETAGGTSKMESLGRDGRIMTRLAPERSIFVIVDNDSAGRDLYRNGRLDAGGRWVRHSSNGVHWCRLPFTEPFRRFWDRCQIPKTNWPGSLENLFDPALREEALRAGILELTATPHDELLNSSCFPRVNAFLPPSREPLRHFVLTVAHESKLPFAEWIVERSVSAPEILEPLRAIVEGIHQVLLGPSLQQDSQDGDREEGEIIAPTGQAS